MNEAFRILSIDRPVLLVVEIVLFAIALGLLIPVTVLFVECSAALFPNRRTKWHGIAPRPRIDVLVPAHNEATGIGATLKTLLPQLTAQDRLVVIADNCDDETATIARTFGATVIERQEPDRRGKGYALDYGLRFIAANPPEVVVVVDADCVVHPGTIDRLARLAAAFTRPVQATYLLNQSANPGPKDAVSALAFMVKNLVRPRGLDQMGLPCLLTGTGMAFPWSVIREVSLASSNIVEDMQLGLDLAIAGHASVFCSDALVTGLLPGQKQAAKSQRTRWEHGHLQTLLKQVPRLFRASLSQKSFELLAIALDLSVPPLSLLVMMWAAAMGGTLFAGVLGASWIPTVLLAIEGLLLTISIVGAWVKFGRANLPVLTLLAVPLYILWKIPLYFAFLMRPQTKWIRTERDVVEARES
jgi:cellulose synthase/poly-beta-1,6-N-acetylglucosamine synthase-like glycosyltransferase